MNKFISRALVVAPLVLAGQAFAALPPDVSTSITGAQTDGVTLIGLMAAAGAAVYLISKVLKKFGIFL